MTTSSQPAVLHVIDSSGIYGAERMLLDLAGQQIRAGATSVVCSLGRESEGVKALERECDARQVPYVRVPIVSGINTLGAAQIVAAADAQGAEVIHTHGFKADCLVAVQSKSRRRRASVATLHGWTAHHIRSRLYWYRQLDLLALSRLDAVVAVTQAMVAQHRLASRLGAKLRVVSNGIDLRAVEQAALAPVVSVAEQQALEFCRARPTLCIVGRLSAEKGHAVLIDALQLARQRGFDLGVLVIGAGGLLAELQAQVARHSLADQVHFSGYVPQPVTLFKACAAMVSSSHTEGLPISMLEAMTLELPIIATAVGGVPELLADGRRGVLVKPADAAGLAEALTLVSTDPKRLRECAIQARLAVGESYTVETMVARYAEVYRQARQAFES